MKLLKTWIPATTDFRDQGLDPTDWVNDNVEMATDGKLGKCLYFNGSNARLSSNTYSLSEKWSWSVWIKDDLDVTGWRIVFILNSNGSDADTQTALWVKADETRLEVCNDTKWVSTVKYVPGQWNHIAQTYDGTTTNVYLNGSRISGFTSTDHLVRTNMTIGGRSTSVDGGHVSTNMFFKGYLNDLRIWDGEVLSPLEVKRLSQGLVLHYPLASPYIENTTNLITTEDCLSSTCYNGATSKYGYGTTTDIYKTVTTFDGRKGTKVYMGTDGNTCYPYVYINYMFTSNGTNSPEYKTLSFDYYTTISTSISPYKLGSGNGTATYKVWANGEKKTGTGTNSVTIPIIPNTWNHVEVTFHGTTDADAQWGYIQMQPAHTSDTSNFWFFANTQLETKDHATGYAGIGGSRDGTELVYDCSGFGYNGIATNISWDSNTARYTGSYLFNGNNSQVKGHMDTLANFFHNDFTMAFWIYDDDKSNRSIYIGNFQVDGAGSGIGIEKTTGGGLRMWWYGNPDYYPSGFTIPDKEWTHIAIAKSSSEVKFYKNGSLINTYTYSLPNSMLVAGTSICFGVDNRTGEGGVAFKGNMSDVRFYASVLSADDILTLYNLGGSLDSNGTFHTYEYVEV